MTNLSTISTFHLKQKTKHQKNKHHSKISLFIKASCIVLSNYAPALSAMILDPKAPHMHIQWHVKFWNCKSTAAQDLPHTPDFVPWKGCCSGLSASGSTCCWWTCPASPRLWWGQIGTVIVLVRVRPPAEICRTIPIFENFSFFINS